MSLHLPSPQDDGTAAMLTEEIVPNRSTADIARSAELAPDEHSLSSRPSNHVAFASSLQMIPETELSTQPSPTDSSQPRRRRARRRRSSRVISDILKIFSSEGRELRRMLGIVLRLLFNIVQVVIITVILALSGTVWHSKSAESALSWTPVTEFNDCYKLAVWDALWAARAVLGCFLVTWELKLYLDKRRRAADRRISDLELADLSNRPLEWGAEIRGPTSGPSILDTPAIAAPSTPTLPSPTYRHDSASGARSPQTPAFAPDPPSRNPSAQRRPSRQSTRETQSPPNVLYDRMDTFLTATGLLHFIVNHIWLYTTVNTCRINDPHVWYLGLSIASLGYLIVAELLLIAFIVFILGPILLLILNLIMLCLGRPVDRHGNVIVRAEIPKMEQSLIEKIPLVVYIPPEEAIVTSSDPEASDPNASEKKTDPVDGSAVGQSSANATTRPARRRFKWLPRRGKKGKAPPTAMWSDAKLVTEGDPRFDTSDHPFVILETNRADCPICLTAFVEPKRKEGVPPAPPRPKTPEPQASSSGEPHANALEGESDPSTPSQGTETETNTQIKQESSPDEPEGEADGDVGVPGEALRLLACGHVFHKPCLDPWLSKTSGRCPVCNRKVEIPDHML